MTSSNEQPPKPDWLNKDPSQWPPEARTLFTILGNIAARRLRRLRERKVREKDQP